MSEGPQRVRRSEARRLAVIWKLLGIAKYGDYKQRIDHYRHVMVPQGWPPMIGSDNGVYSGARVLLGHDGADKIFAQVPAVWEDEDDEAESVEGVSTHNQTEGLAPAE